jgi:hypothetical protein
MTWLATAAPARTLGEALALRPDLLAGYRALEAAFADEPALDDALRARCRARVAALVGGVPTPSGPADAGDVVLEFVEQFVLDAQGVSDGLVARLGAVLGPRAIVALAQAVAVWESEHRLARCLAVSPEL